MCPAVRFREARTQSSRDLTADPSAGMGVASIANGIEGRDYFVVKVGKAAADWEFVPMEAAAVEIGCEATPVAGGGGLPSM